tara:strand:- start:380 stop:577 length:198 start_codon:yes stop_codon:yes gene_type:complete
MRLGLSCRERGRPLLSTPINVIVWLQRTIAARDHRRADQFIASSEMARSGKSEPAFLPVKVTIFL